MTELKGRTPARNVPRSVWVGPGRAEGEVLVWIPITPGSHPRVPSLGVGTCVKLDEFVKALEALRGG